MPFSDQLWESVADVRARIRSLPFTNELAQGTLSPARFQYYMVQDALYLERFARALAAAASKAPDREAVSYFSQAAHTAIVVEKALHEHFMTQFGIDPAQAAATPPSPTCQAYCDFQMATAQQGSYGSLVAAVLPCFWIYQVEGDHIAAIAAAENPYQAWIDTYADPGFADQTRTAIAMLDRAAALTGEADRSAMAESFRRATIFEWQFWDAAYRMEGPITADWG